MSVYPRKGSDYVMLLAKYYHDTDNQVLLVRVSNITESCTFLPHRAKEIRPPSSSPAGMLLMAFIRSPAQAQITRGLIEIAVPSLRTLPRSSFATKVNKKMSLHIDKSIKYIEQPLDLIFCYSVVVTIENKCSFQIILINP